MLKNNFFLVSRHLSYSVYIHIYICRYRYYILLLFFFITIFFIEYNWQRFGKRFSFRFQSLAKGWPRLFLNIFHPAQFRISIIYPQYFIYVDCEVSGIDLDLRIWFCWNNEKNKDTKANCSDYPIWSNLIQH